jgi:DNA repair exonuclease SbcCD ATPase subunit
MMLFINPITALIGAFNIATDVMDKLGISLQQPVSKAASEMRVLNNQVKDLNKNISEARREAGKLETALENFEKLQNIVFKTRQETEDLIAAQEALQEILGINLSGSSLQIFARGELAKQQRQIQEDLAEVERLTDEFFAENDGVN